MTNEPGDVGMLADAAYDAFCAAMRRDIDAASTAMTVLAVHGPVAVMAACCSWLVHLDELDGPLMLAAGDVDAVVVLAPGEPWTLTACRGGQPVDLDGTGLRPAEQTALRMLAACGSHGLDTIEALVLAAWQAGPDDVSSLMVETLTAATRTLEAMEK